MKNPLTEKSVQRFLKAVLHVKTTGEAGAFFRDICTESELIEMGKRLQAAELFRKGETIRSVAGKVGLSTTTAARVARWYKSGDGGYELVLSRLLKS
jgi:TrpR-related protein YerC/YecD